MIVNDDSRVINKLEALLTDDTRVIIYDRNMFSVQATGANTLSGARKLLTALLTNIRQGLDIASSVTKRTNLLQ